MRRSDEVRTWRGFARVVWREMWTSWCWVDYAVVVVVMALAFVLYGCAALSTKPSGIPGCPERQRWSDSAQACVTREGK